jgi:endonuclease-3 related protein
MAKNELIKVIYNRLLERYGTQGWWPLVSKAGKPGFDERGYHKGNYDFPKTHSERFEIGIGAILTQNTAWRNVELAFSMLMDNKLLSPEQIGSAPEALLKASIKPCGYFNQKAKKLVILARFFLTLRKRKALKTPSRDELLGLWGIGNETADSILLYAFKEPFFVVDAYTKRIFERLGVITPKLSYDAIQELFHEALPREPEIYNEYHALIVEHAKVHCRKKPNCVGCIFEETCA